MDAVSSSQVSPSHTRLPAADLAARLVKLAPPAELRIAIERPTGLVVDTLVESKFAVVPIHPNVVKAARPRYSAAQGKTDLGDAYLLADLLRTDGHRFRTLAPLSDETKALRGLVRVRDDLVRQRVATANQLRCLLDQFWPGAEIRRRRLAVARADRYPAPQSARLGEAHGCVPRGTLLRSSCSRQLVERLRSAPASVAGG
jgi:transposase